ncbi:hypothetical protein, partial [Bacteroides acidifaciens]
EPPYAEPHVRWCERTSEHERRRTPLISVHLLLDFYKKRATAGRESVFRRLSPYMGESRSAEWCHAVLFTGIIIFR